MPLAEDPSALEQLRVKREQEVREREGAAGTSGDMSENGDGITRVMFVFVCGWGTGAIAVAHGFEGWDACALDEVLSDGEWELPSHVPLIRFGGRACLLSYTYLLLELKRSWG